MKKTGPDAFRELTLFNQHIWDASPERAKERMLEAISNGGFDEDCIRRRVGNYEGQIMAIRADWVDGKPYGWRGEKEKDAIDVWRLNALGAEALRMASKPVPVLLPARDDWHSRATREKVFQYCVFELERDGKPMLRLFKEAIPCGASWGMEPVLRRADVVALRDYLKDWLARHPKF